MEWLKFKQPLSLSDIHSCITPFPMGQIELQRMEGSDREREDRRVITVDLVEQGRRGMVKFT